MNIIQENSLMIIVILLILLLFAAGLIVYIKYDVKQEKDKPGGPSLDVVSQKKHNEILEKYNQASVNLKSMKIKYEQLEKKYEDEKSQNVQLNNKIDELSRDNSELNKLFEKESAHIAEQQFTMVVVPKDLPKQQNQEVVREQEQPKQELVAKVPVTAEIPSSEAITTKEKPPVVPAKEVIMYASFPRSAGSSIYFSDLTENLVDDSFFELKISNANGKATFKPLDFMKIRNYDPAMAAMLTNGVKPNVASTVLGIEPGKAHIEGKDWIIDNPAKIKLA